MLAPDRSRIGRGQTVQGVHLDGLVDKWRIITMTRQGTSPSKSAPREALDDFTRIQGIGPAIEKRLHRAGLYTFADLAASSAEEIAALLPNSSAKQIIKQDWISQARKLVPGKAKSHTRNNEPFISTSRQHYNNFTLEFLLDEKNRTRRMRVVHVQSGDVDTWARWDPERLIDFLARHTGAHLPYAKSAIPTAARPSRAVRSSITTEQPSERISDRTSVPPISLSNEISDSQPSLEISKSTPQRLDPAHLPAAETVAQQLPSAASPVSTLNRVHLLEWKTLVNHTIQSSRNLPHDQAFDINLTLDLTNASWTGIPYIDFTLSLCAKRLGDGHRQMIGEAKGTIPYANIIDLTIRNASLPQGLYRLEALLTLIPGGSSLVASRVSVSFPGGLFQVY
jgi:hypothetical protein